MRIEPNIMPDGDIRNVTKRAYFVVKHKIPAIHDKPSNGVEHDKLLFLSADIFNCH